MSKFDIIMIGDFRFPGGTSVATAHEIRALAGAGFSIGLIQSNADILRQARPMHPMIRATVSRNEAAVIPAGTRRAEGRLGIIHNPMAFTKYPKGLPAIELGHAIMVAHQPHTDRNGVPYYDAMAVHQSCKHFAGDRLAWAPISPSVRKNLERTAPGIPLVDLNWHNTIFPEEWATERSRPLADVPVIGRHSRPDRDKWPATRRDILEVYPGDASVQVRILGAGDHLKRVMGVYPENWTAYRFG
jgi:hypothetical protein